LDSPSRSCEDRASVARGLWHRSESNSPGGCYFSFNWAIDRQTSAKLVDAITLAHVEGYDRVNLLLSSTGGLLIDAHYAVECLAAVPTELIMWNMSVVQSAANMLFALGVQRYATPGSSFMFRQTAFEGVAGQRTSEKEVREQLRQIEIADRRSADFIAATSCCADFRRTS